MKRQSQQIEPTPNVAYNTGGGTVESPAKGSVSPELDVSFGREGFTLQLIGVAGGQTFAVDGSLDEGNTWIEITSSMTNLGAADALVTPPLAADGLYQFPHVLPGMARLRCVASTAGTPAEAYLNFQDSRVAE